MAKKHFEFRIHSKHKPSVEITAGGLYVRFQPNVKVARTIVRSEWPHVALDLSEDNTVVGIECVPTPNQFSLGAIAKQAGVTLPMRMSARDVQISSPSPAPETLVSA